MSKDDDSLIDKDGVIYVRGWDGYYRPKHGIFGPERDVGILGEPRIEVAFMGDLLIACDSGGNPIYSSDGEQLYRRTGTRNPSTGNRISDLLANSGEHGFAVIFILFLVLSVLLGYVVIFLIGAIALLGPALLGGWMLVRGWARQPAWLKWVWALSWFVTGYIFGWLATHQVGSGLLGSYPWLAYLYYTIGVLALAGMGIATWAGRRDGPRSD